MKKFWIPVIFFMLSFYCFGAGIMDSFAIYHSWLFVGDHEFAAVHKATGERIVLLLVLPMLMLTVFCVLLFWHRPAVIPKKLVTIALVALLAGWLSSAFIQIPIQIQLDQGKDEALLRKLISTDWIRTAAWFIYIITVIQMIQKAGNGYLKLMNTNREKQTVYSDLKTNSQIPEKTF